MAKVVLADMLVMLHQLHNRRGLVHRDIKLDNIIMGTPAPTPAAAHGHEGGHGNALPGRSGLCSQSSQAGQGSHSGGGRGSYVLHVIDFGLAACIGTLCGGGTVEWMPPELLCAGGYQAAATSQDW